MAPSDKFTERSRCGSDESESDILILQIDHRQFQFLDEKKNYGAQSLPFSFQSSDSQIFREISVCYRSDIPTIEMANPVCLVHAVDDDYTEEEQGFPLMASSKNTSEAKMGSPTGIVQYAFYDGKTLDYPLIELVDKGYQLPFFR